MIIGIASGKGGTGKTTIAVNLSLYLSQSQEVSLFDLDVEEPNVNHFLHYPLKDLSPINLLKPEIDESKCTHCGLCAELCEFNALAVLPNMVLTFTELCHGCGLCTLACPEKAITEVPHRLGTISTADHESVNPLKFYQGILRVGEAIAVPIIHGLKKLALEKQTDHAILDLPPGASCPVIEGLTDIDFLVLVTEPTPAGLHDLEIAIEVAKDMEIPFGIIINRSDVGDDCVDRLIEKNNYPLLLKIPHSKEIYQLYSRGIPLIGASDKYTEIFSTLWTNIMEVTKQ